MSDNLKRYLAIKRALRQLYPKEPQGRLAQSLNVLAMFINGIVTSKSTHMRQVAKKTPQPGWLRGQQQLLHIVVERPGCLPGAFERGNAQLGERRIWQGVAVAEPDVLAAGAAEVAGNLSQQVVTNQRLEPRGSQALV